MRSTEPKAANGAAYEVQVTDLVSGYGDVTIVRGVSMNLSAGRLTALIGSNGVGKTTLLRTIAGLLRVRSGRIVACGEDITHYSAHRRAQLGLTMVPEGRQLFPSMTVLENLELGATPIRKDKRRVHNNLERVFDLFPRLKERATQQAMTLSGGEQQMVALARGLMAGPRVIMFDELSLGLAPVMTTSLYEALRTLKAAGQTMLLVEQNVHLALAICDDAYVLSEGKVWMHGSAADLASRPEVRQAFLGI